MAIKLKGWTTRLGVKIICVSLIPVMAFVFLLGAVGSLRLPMNYINDYRFLFADLSNSDYFFDSRMYNITMNLEEYFSFAGQEGIRNGDYIEWQRLEPIVYIEYLENGRYVERAELRSRLISTNRASGWSSWGEVYEQDSDEGRSLEETAIRDQLKQYSHVKSRVDAEIGLYYYITDGQRVLSNLPPERQNIDFFRTQPVYLIQDGWALGEVSHNSNTAWGRVFGNDDAITHIAYSQEIVDWQNAQWLLVQQELNAYFAMIITSLLVALAMIIILLIGVGRRYGDSGGVQFIALDKPWLDIGLATLILYEVGISILFIDYIETAFRYDSSRGIIGLCIAFAICFVLPALWWLTSFTKRCKAGKFWRHILIYVVIIGIYRKFLETIKSLWAGFPLTVRGVTIGVILLVSHFVCIGFGTTNSGAIGLAIILSLIISASAIFLLLRYARKLHLLEQGAKVVSEGSYNTLINVSGGKLGSIAASINSISGGINAAVIERMKSERLKTELITNVSHDIRTPLTSLITYTDLLKNEGLDSDNAPEYLDVLIQKSARLKTLTDDLFEASKAASGNITTQIETLDLADFIRQVLGELDERVKLSGLDFRLNLPEHANILADGRLLWRVVENLLSNVFKYALAGSRVYIDVVPDGDCYRLDIKNISEHPLNVEPSELIERFKRGDDARADEGSGLGLSIAQSFVQAQGGQFTLSIDGDLFKAAIYMPK